ncbi:MAG: bifunctional (p)ppGpp synthetase/guanosine-3',5'-bis(diphosphate) 3'-pyrophosphohydrolase [Oscillospiraceae bacterium]|nr:bifunctional (p)ppGpp synthetase/guanosine-3',5'-bis(diphosphate) 3'-pyrophosphohydrolase [Oscillospiraceae bacterium]
MRELHTEYEQLKVEIGKYAQSFDYELLDRAYECACEAHSGQNRVSGEPYIMHPLNVALILAGLELDIGSIVSGLLHDVVEDTFVTLDDLSAMFGDTIAQIVDGVTKLENIPYTSIEEQQSENIRKMILAMSKDIRVILIKLADRLHNMRTLYDMPPEHRIIKSKETLEIYAPLANRLGIFRVQSELEDLCLRYLEPEAYDELTELLSVNQVEREAPISDVAHLLGSRLEELHINAHIEYRMKHLYSIYRKMRNQDKPLDKIYDIYALRIIVNTVSECYTALGTAHNEYTPVPGRFKDYIAISKPNQYQSLHTTLIGESGAPFEVQIRTWDMHRVAEFGIAAHWKYKESASTGSPRDRSGPVSGYSPGAAQGAAPTGQGAGDGALDLGFDLNEDDQKLAWLRQLIEWQRDVQDSDDFVEDLKIDLFSDTVFAFSPKGDVFALANGSTPIDFAYRVHSAIGNRMNGARVNGRIVPISYTLQNGDIVEIITSVNEHGPSRDWLDIVKSGQARSKIRQWFKRENREENIVRGKELVDKEIKRQGYLPSQLLRADLVDRLIKRYNFAALDDAYSAVGYNGISSTKLVFRLVEEYNAVSKTPPETVTEFIKQNSLQQGVQELKKVAGRKKRQADSEILVRGVANCLVRTSHCCNPVPGDPIVGYITRSRGVSVHRFDCVNVVNSVDDDNRLVEVSWYDQVIETYQAAILIVANDRPVLISDITSSIGELMIPIKNINAKVSRDNLAMIDLILEIVDKTQLDTIIRKINGIDSVIRVTRSIH